MSNLEVKKRVRTLLFILSLLFFLILLRLIYLQILTSEFYKEKSLEQRKRIITLAADRGDIFDRSLRVLATSLDTYSVFLVPQKIEEPERTAEKLSKILGEERDKILSRTKSPKSFVFVKRKIGRDLAQKIQSEKLSGVGLLKEKKRVYPQGHLASQILGFVGIDNQGLSGVELALDRPLKGEEGQLIIESDPVGREILTLELESPSDGMEVTLTIDEYLQYISEREIEKQIQKYKAASGMLILMDSKTGEILALASKPDFDPNCYEKSPPKLWHPRFLDPYEPGSTFKIITVASALEEGVITPDTKLKALDSIEVGGRIIKNSHPVKWPGPTISISKMLEESINTGAVQVGLKLGPERFYKHIKNFGFGEPTGLGFLGESRGIVRDWRQWYKPDLGMFAFGQSLAVTPLQLISAFSAFANGGEMVPPQLIKRIESLDGKFVKVFKGERRRAISQATAEKVKELMKNVVLKGSGRRARLENFGVAGKTGTAQKVALGGRGYLEGHYIASFIGLAPYADPQLIALVIIDDPEGSIWGEVVAGPVFKNVVEEALRYLNVPLERVSSRETS